jgi:hypothetical protein
MRRRDFVLCGTAAAATALSQPATAQTIGQSGFSDDIVIAFDGLDYPSWSASQLHVGLLAFVSVSVPANAAPFTVTMSLLRGSTGQDPVPARAGEQFDPYRSSALAGTVTDWAVIDRHAASITLFIPYACVDTSKAPTGTSSYRLYFRIIEGKSRHIRDYDRVMPLQAEFKHGGYLVQRMVHPKFGPNALEPFSVDDITVFRYSFSNRRVTAGLGNAS